MSGTGRVCISLFLVIFSIGCKPDTKKESDKIIAESPIKSSSVVVVTKGMEFQCTDTITSGWNTFVYKNLSTEPHFILLDKYPEGKSIKDMEAYVLPPFDEGMALIMEGKNEEAMEAFGKLPEWFSQIVFSGGIGLISPKETAITHVNLQPGYYIMECYVKMPNGQFHSSMGMIKELIVLDVSSGNKPPNSDIEIIISSEKGIVIHGDASVGKNVFSVKYGDQIVHENFVGHDINLARLDDGANLDTLETWMNWAIPRGLMSASSPEGIKFLGGTNDSPEGSVLYFEADLKPGNYVFVSEVPNAREKGMLQTFTVSE
ncbi:MAG: hypothetical protein ACR2MM_07325 [Flavobacteriaceae bacterium]